MKYTLIILTFLLTTCSANFTYGQDDLNFSNYTLKGKWTASCPPEIIDHASMRQCELCPFVINPNDKSNASIKDIEMNFITDSIAFNQNGKLTIVPFKTDRNSRSISFTLNNKDYNFRMFLDKDRRILENSDGLIIVLEKDK